MRTQYQAGDIVFSEATEGSWTLYHRLTSVLCGGTSTVHTSIASGYDTLAYQATRAGGLEEGHLHGPDLYSTFRHRDAEVGKLIKNIAESYVAHRGVGHISGRYVHYPTLLRAFAQTDSEEQQWGNPLSAGAFYCSNLVARCLLAAQQVCPSTRVYSGLLPAHLTPIALKDFLAHDYDWVRVPD